jgi:hypothetical protein
MVQMPFRKNIQMCATLTSSQFVAQLGWYKAGKKIALILFFLLPLAKNIAAQDTSVAPIPQLIQQKNYFAARNAIDNLVNSQPNAENYLIRAEIYYNLAQNKNTEERVVQAIDSAISSFYSAFAINQPHAQANLKSNKFILSNQIFGYLQNQAIQSYKQAATQNNAAGFTSAYKNYQQAINFYQFLVQQKLNKTGVDTLSHYFGAISAAKAELQVEALLLSRPLTQNNIASHQGQSFEKLYQWLAFYYNSTNNANLLNSSTLQGKKLYPQSPFFYHNAINYYKKQGNSQALAGELQSLCAKNLDKNPQSLFSELTNLQTDSAYKPQKTTFLQIQTNYATQLVKANQQPNFLIQLGNFFTLQKKHQLALTAFNQIIKNKKNTTNAIYIYALQQGLLNATALKNKTFINYYAKMLQ